MSTYDKIIRALVISMLIAFIVGAYALVTYRTTANTRVIAIGWVRKINIEEFRTVHEDSWNLPADARDVTTTWEYHHSERYLSGSHEECKTDSRGEETCDTVTDYSYRPVYKDRYHYNVDRWVVARTPVRTGTTHDAEWPDVSDIRDAHNPPHIGDERPGQRASRYSIVLTDKDKLIYPADMDESLWRTFSVGDTALLELNIFGDILSITKD